MIINNEPNRYCNRVEDEELGMPVRNYWLNVVTGGAEFQTGAGIARDWIADLKIDQCPMMVLSWSWRGQWCLQEAALIKC